MSNTIYDFLTESFLFQERYYEDNFSAYSKEKIRKELQKYREYCINNLENVTDEIDDNKYLSLYTEAYKSYLPKYKFLKQCLLYFDQFVIDDPIFKLTHEQGSFATEASKYIGYQDQELDVFQLIKAIKYMKAITPFVAGGFVKFVPASYMHEPLNEIPLTYSKVYFKDVLPDNILKWFYKHANVYPLKRDEKGWYVDINAELTPCRGISIDFENHLGNGYIYHLFQSETISYNEDTHIATFKQTLPKEPPDVKLFEAWVFQSTNQAARNFFNGVFKDLFFSLSHNLYYITQSSVKAELLTVSFPTKENINDQISNLFLNLDLPILENVAFDKLMDIRLTDGEAFESFRNNLKTKLLELRTLKDPDMIKVKLDNIKYELEEVNVAEVVNQISKLKKKAIWDASAIITATLAATVQTSGWGLLALVASLVNGYKTYEEYKNSIKQNPGYLFWKIKK